MRAKLTLSVLVVGLLALVGCTQQRQSASAQPTTQVPELNLSAPLPAVAATYVTTRAELVHDAKAARDHVAHESEPLEWRFFREVDRVEIEDLRSQSGELWQRDGATQFFFKLFHADRRSIEYRTDDLLMLEISPSWQQHALLMEPATLEKMTLVEAGWRDGYPYRRLRSVANNEMLEVTWRVDLNVPMQIERRHGDHVETTVLKTLYPLDKSPWARRDHSAYEVIDYADLGDRESDPFVARIQKQLPGGHQHHH